MPHRTTPHSDIASGCCVIKNSIRAHQHTAYARPAAEGLRRNGLASSSYRRKPEPSPSNMSKAHSMSCCGPSKPSLRMACANSTLSMDPDELPSQEWKTSMMLSPVASSASASCSVSVLCAELSSSCRLRNTVDTRWAALVLGLGSALPPIEFLEPRRLSLGEAGGASDSESRGGGLRLRSRRVTAFILPLPPSRRLLHLSAKYCSTRCECRWRV
mmetsp:Transcript_6485/g.20835  ORF Transcript_6485/g.20835 Transcript_6485/m.20835 type:complete len:215 (+) Transcript_6485:77-721(+)